MGVLRYGAYGEGCCEGVCGVDEMNDVCGCLGAMYGEPYCPCQMEQRGLQHFMDNNPVRKAAEYDSAQRWKKFMDEGGFDKYEEK